MLNNFTYHLELNELDKISTKQKLKDKISKYNQESFLVNSGHKIELYLPWYTDTKNDNEVTSVMLHFKLLQLAIDKYISIYDINDLPMYAQYIAKLNFTIQQKDFPSIL